jgi:FtsH-binding integral membrane protein
MEEVLDQHYEGQSQQATRDFFKNVYGYMFAALGVSGVIAYLAGTPEFVGEYFVTQTGLSPLFYVVMFAPIGVALFIQSRYQKLSMSVLMLLFLGYAVLIGLTFSVVLMMYSGKSVATIFFITSAGFGSMAILGYTTKTDLTKMGSVLYMLFIGIFIGTIINMFMGSTFLQTIISLIGVFVFTGLTAYYMQKLKATAQDETLSTGDKNKLALIGGLQLYILFINLFMSLLNLFGRD